MKRQGCGKRIILGLTGSFGSGKTSVAEVFRSFGARIIDADKIAHRLIEPKTKIYKKIVDTFGKGILRENRAIDRNKLGRVVFNDKRLLKKLNRIVHPEIIKVIKEKIKDSSEKLIVLDAPLLLEAGLGRIMDKIIVVRIKQEKQIERIRKKTGLVRQVILKRIKSQMPLSNKVRVADFVIDNNGTIKETKKQAEKIRRLLWKR